jgi:immune inhibitor A
VEFPDIAHKVDKAQVERLFFTRLNSYIKEMSYDKFCIEGDVTRWYKMPHPISHYSISPRNLEVDRSRIMGLVNDALDAADKDVDFSKYAFQAIYMGATREEYGMVGLCGYPGMLGWAADTAQKLLRTKKSQVVNGGVAIFTNQAHLGTLFHDTAHVLGGVKDGKRLVPCLYDHDLQAKPGPIYEAFLGAIVNMGFWDPMSCHFYKRDVPPPGISSWTKIRLGWMAPSRVKVIKPGERAEVLLGPLEDGTSETLVVKIPISETTYYLLENRQPIGHDKNLPGSGVLIMYADDRIAECRKGEAPVKLMNADPQKPNLEGAAFDVDKKAVFVDKRNKIEIRVLEKIGPSYKLAIGPYAG